MGDGKQLMVFPFTVPTDGTGQMRDPAQGVYARSLARTLAERLSVAPSMNAIAATLTSGGPVKADTPPPAPADDTATGWVVASQPWTLDEAVKVGLPDGTEYLLHGVAELTDRIRQNGTEKFRTVLLFFLLHGVRPSSPMWTAPPVGVGSDAQSGIRFAVPRSGRPDAARSRSQRRRGGANFPAIKNRR